MVSIFFDSTCEKPGTGSNVTESCVHGTLARRAWHDLRRSDSMHGEVHPLSRRVLHPFNQLMHQ